MSQKKMDQKEEQAAGHESGGVLKGLGLSDFRDNICGRYIDERTRDKSGRHTHERAGGRQKESTHQPTGWCRHGDCKGKPEGFSRMNVLEQKREGRNPLRKLVTDDGQ